MSTLRVDGIQDVSQKSSFQTKAVALVDEGYTNLGEYTAALEIENYQSKFTRNGVSYRPLITTTLPYTLTGIWADEGDKFAPVKETTTLNLLDFASEVITKPDPSDPTTWDWSPAFQAAVNSLPLNTADVGILNPKYFPTGGTVYIPRGLYKVFSKITLRRGIQIIGEGREASQIVSHVGADSVFQYTDAGRYIQDELVFRNLSIWQHDSVVATAGAAIDVIEGAATPDSLTLIVDNVYIEQTFYGIRIAAGVGCQVTNSNVSKTVNHGFWQTGVVSTTSTVIQNSYFHICGGNGVHIDQGAYIALVGVASDSNTLSGYKITGKNVSMVSCGAEANSQFGVHLVNAQSSTVSVFTIANGSHGIQIDNCLSTVVQNSYLDGTTGEGIHHINPVGSVTVIGTTFVGSYNTTHTNSQFKYLELSANNGLVGATNKWAIGSTQQPEADCTFAVMGDADSATRNILKVAGVHTATGTRNTASWSQFITANTAVSYTLGIGMFVPNAVKGAAATHQRTAGVYVSEQTTGTTANANLMIDAGAGTVPAGNFSIYSDSTRDSVFKGPIRVGPAAATAPLIFSGTGSPEGVVTAPVGSLFLRTDAATSLYVKQTGAGNTGWVVK